MSTRNFTVLAWGTLAWNVGVVLWGAFVRASGSGAGCGNHWPLCNGQVVPQAAEIQTIIEFTHRVMSGVAFFAVAGLWLWSLRIFPRRNRVRTMALASFCFLISEALLGAGLVLFDYVGANGSAGRALYLSLHLANTLLLLAALALTAWFSREPEGVTGQVPRIFAVALPLALLVSVSGAIAALGDTLFPASSLGEGIRQDFSGTAHFLLRLRVFHPALAVAAGIFFAWIAIAFLRAHGSRDVDRLALVLLVVTLLQLCAGAANLALLAPVWMQIVHLFLADLVWVSLVLLAAESAAGVIEEAPARAAFTPHIASSM
ncbi:MAG TPA: COX15/CtaA family protein [Bryobacteraceae bacterium]|nr:COX15/CtaA family protein [Bryobacteraceae bacterium]